MAVRLTRAWGFNPGFGMQTTNVEAGTETLYHCNLAAPIQRAGAPEAEDWNDGDDLLLIRTKTSNRISRLEIFNDSGVAFLPSFFFAFFKDGKIVFPKYSENVGTVPITSCIYSLACSIATDNTTPSGIAIGANSHLDIWRRVLADGDTGAGGTKACTARIAAGVANADIRPQLEPNIGSIMDKTLRADVGDRGALAINPDGLSEMSPIDTDVAICMHIGSKGLSQDEAANVVVKIGIIETDISARNETEEYVKSWTQIPAQGVFDGDGITLPYAP